MTLTNRKAAARTLATDYKQKTFKDKNLLLFEVFRANLEQTGEVTVKGVSFINCQIEGPAVMLPLSGCKFDDCNFGITHGDMRTLILYPASTERVTGAVPMLDCVFEAVDFFSVGFTGQKPFLDSMLEIESRA